MKLVQFPDGTFGIRRGIPPFCKYLDFEALGRGIELWHKFGRYINDTRRPSALVALAGASKLKRHIPFVTSLRSHFRTYGTPMQDVRRGDAR